MLLVIGVLAALLHARATGSGQVVDAAIVDGSALLMTSHHGFMAEGWWAPEREANPLDGAAPYYTTYETLDGEHMAVGAIEPQFYASLLHGLELTEDDAPAQSDRESWPILREILAAKFIEGTRDEWANRFEGTDACVAPVLSMVEAPKHAHNVARGLFSDVEGVLQPGPAPRFSSTVTADPSGPSIPGADTDSILEDLGFGSSQIGMLRSTGVVA
jgi:alpha-methylacyl-CoA racemase